MKHQEFTYSYPRPALTTDCVLLQLCKDDVRVLLVERKNEPYKGAWAFPGGFVEENETVEACAARELQEETRLSQVGLHQFRVYSQPGRDPRGWTVTTAFFACMSRDEDWAAEGGDDAAQARWFPIQHAPSLAFDHAQILADVLDELRRRMVVEPLVFDFLNAVFTFEDVDILLSTLFGPDADAFSWLQRMRKSGMVTLHNADIPSFTFHRQVYERLLAKGPVSFV